MATISVRSFKVECCEEDLGEIPRSARRIVLNADLLKASKLSSGDVVAVSKYDPSSKHDHKSFAVGVAWASQDVPADTILVSVAHKLTAALTEGDKAQIFPLNSSKTSPDIPSLRQAQEARAIHLKEVFVEDRPSRPTVSGAPTSEKGKRRDWLPLLIREALVNLKYVTPTQSLDVIYEGQCRRFAVSSVSTFKETQPNQIEDLAADLSRLKLTNPRQLWTVGWDTMVSIIDEKKDLPPPEKISTTHVVKQDDAVEAYASVGGLEKQIVQIRDLIEIPLTRPELFHKFGLKPPRGILLHGPPGTGKTHLARAIAASTKSSVLIVNGPELSSAYHGETESKLRDVFADARARSPCIVVLDEVDALCPRREEGPGGEVEKRVVAQLLTILDGVEDESGKDRVVVVATTNRPNAIDPALRRPGRFDREIEIGIPDAQARYDILNVLLRKIPHSLNQDDIRSVASRAHGYVGADLSAVVREAGTAAIKRYLTLHTTSSVPEDKLANNIPQLTPNDLLTSLTNVRPSGLRSVFLDTVPVRFSDVGGQADTIQKLRECVEWPLLHPEAFERLGVRPPKGVLLYGPPGCSKTLLVRACATESGVNFVAVKGPELLNKYVGESERAVREIFRKARAAAPSIIFFDEIDALGTSRSGSDGGASHEGVLTSLLNEMDGVEELIGVTVVAATNRPDVIDSALMRPGRLDRIVYVGPPDQAGREDIIRICTRKMSVEPSLDITHLARLTEGCSGAEIKALCQEAALLTMKHDLNSPYVSHGAFLAAANLVKKQITPSMLQHYEQWSSQFISA